MKKWQQEFLKIYRQYYANKKAQDPSYSIRNMAKQLNISPGPASALLKGSRTWDFSTEWVLDVIKRMDIPASSQNKLLVLMGEAPKIRKDLIPPESSEKLFTTWYYSVILYSVDLNDKKMNSQRLSHRLGISTEEAQSAIDYLISKKFLSLTPEGYLTRTTEVIETTDDIPHTAIRQHHHDNLELAQKALQKIEVNQREFQTITFAGKKSQIEEIKTEIRTFLDRIAVLMDQNDANDEIYRFSLQLFPINFQEASER